MNDVLKRETMLRTKLGECNGTGYGEKHTGNFIQFQDGK